MASACGKICSSNSSNVATSTFACVNAAASTSAPVIASKQRTTIITSSKERNNTSTTTSNSQQNSKTCASGYVTVMEIGGGETSVVVVAPTQKSKSCTRAASLSRKRGPFLTSEDPARSSSVPPNNGTVLLRINTGCDKEVKKSVASVANPARPIRKQSIKIGSECQDVRQPLHLKRSYSANSEIRSHSTTSLCARQSLSETHRANKSLEEKAASNQSRSVSASDTKNKVI